jgi:hypothetical protein
MSKHLLDKISEEISDSNTKMAIPLLDELTERNLLNTCIIGTDGEDRISLHWPNSRLFCEIRDGAYIISVIPPLPYTIQDIKIVEYSPSDIKSVCDRIFALVC